MDSGSVLSCTPAGSDGKHNLAGTLFLDCVPLGNSSAPACFIDDNLAGKPAACEPATADAAAPLQTVLVTPVGTDGLAGSLCQLQVSSSMLKCCPDVVCCGSLHSVAKISAAAKAQQACSHAWVVLHERVVLTMCLQDTHNIQPNLHQLAYQSGLRDTGVGHRGPVHNLLQLRPAVHPSGGALHRQQLRLLRACCKPPCSGTCPCSLASSTRPQPSRFQPSSCQPSSGPTAACQLAGGACIGQKHHERHRLRPAHGGARGPAHILRLERHG